MIRPKVAMFANTDWYLYNFRLNLARRLQQCGCEVVLISPAGEYRERLVSSGFRHIPFDFSTRSTNPLRELLVLTRLIRLLRQERFDLLHNFTIKPVIYGSVAAWLSNRVPVVNSVTGLGHIFVDPGLKARLLRPLVWCCYWLVFARDEGARVIFQNEEDLQGFVDLGIIRRSAARVIRGSGVNCRRFSPQHSAAREVSPLHVRVLFASRLLREKGIIELIDAARLLHERAVPARVMVAGDYRSENPSSLSAEEVETIRREGVVQLLGHVEDMPGLLAEADIVVLPSYREGTPKILLEAAAMALPLIATDVPGCRGVVRHGINGLLVPARDASALARAIETLVRNRDLRQSYGRAGRKLIKEKFEESLVLDRTLEVYRELASLPESCLGEGLAMNA